MFGQGIVETSDNFGSQGSPPTHPELLDWLAVEFHRHSGWDMKRLLKLHRPVRNLSPILTAPAPNCWRAIPANQLLARGPARRLTAEMLRDQALAVSGLLVGKNRRAQRQALSARRPVGRGDGQAAIRPRPRRRPASPQPVHLLEADHPPADDVTFDAADRSVCTVRRQTTSTPLQALVLLNDPQMTEAARFVSQRMLREGGVTTDARAAWAFQNVTSRAPSRVETQVLAKLFAEQHELFAADPDAAKKLLSVGDLHNDPALDATDLAAGTVLALAILNHDEAAMRR